MDFGKYIHIPPPQKKKDEEEEAFHKIDRQINGWIQRIIGSYIDRRINDINV